jgi:cytochrome c biogenesis protein ResB
MKTIGQNPQANVIMAALQAHIAEHMGFHYRQLIEQQMGVPLPPPEEKLPEDVEVQLSRLIAQAGAQLLQQNTAQAQQAQNQQMAQDPMIQMQQQELQLKGQEVQRKQQKDATDAQLKQSQQQIERERIMTQKDIDMARLQADIAKNKLSLDADKETDKRRVLADLIKARNGR